MKVLAIIGSLLLSLTAMGQIDQAIPVGPKKAATKKKYNFEIDYRFVTGKDSDATFNYTGFRFTPFELPVKQGKARPTTATHCALPTMTLISLRVMRKTLSLMLAH